MAAIFAAMQQALTIVTLGVEDIERSKAFYKDVFGWTPSREEGIVFFQMNGLVLSLYNRHELAEDAQVSPEGSGFRAFTLAVNLPSREAVDAAFAEIGEKGGTIAKPAQEVFWGGYSGYVQDPDGNLWEIAHNPFMELNADGTVAKV